MKKIIIAILLTVTIGFWACERKDAEIQINIVENQIKSSSIFSIESVTDFGIAHNQVLDYFENEIEFPGEITSLEDGLDFAYGIILDFCNIDEKGFTDRTHNLNKDLLQLEKSEYLFFGPSGNQNNSYLDQVLKEVKMAGYLDLFVISKMEEISQFAKDGFDYKKTTSDFILYLSEVQEELTQKQNAICPDAADVLLGIISISMHSAEWWSNNSQKWVWLDVAGALIGAGHQLIISGGDLGWGTAQGALLGAAAGSGGAVGRLGRWLRNLF